MILPLAAAIALGLSLGKVLPRWIGQSPFLRRFQTALLVAMLLVLGARLGIQQARTPTWIPLFSRSLVLALGCIAGSVLFTWPCVGWLPPPDRSGDVVMPNPLRLLGLALGSLSAGAVLGARWPDAFPAAYLEPAACYLLCTMVFTIGLAGGSKESVGPNLRSLTPRLLLVPVAISLGSVFGGCVVGMTLGLAPHEGAAIGAGCGWYSFTTILLGKLSGPELGSYGLLVNLFREAASLLVIPVMARWHRGLLLLGPAGCTAMDTTLPMLSRLGGERLGLMAFLTGIICSLLVPGLVPFVFAHLP